MAADVESYLATLYARACQAFACHDNILMEAFAQGEPHGREIPGVPEQAAGRGGGGPAAGMHSSLVSPSQF